MNFIKKNGKGIGMSLLIAVPSWLLVKIYRSLEVIGAPVFAILLGMCLGMCVKSKEQLKSGIGFTSKHILKVAVVLLGFGLNLTTIKEVGITSLPIIVCTISTALLTAYLLQKVLHIPGKISILVGVGSCICGGSAIAAAAPVIDADEEEIAQSISVIFLFNIVAALTFPALGQLLGLSDTGFGLFAGTAINDTSSVTAAASTWDTLHGTGGAVLAYATIVKLTRTLAIIPICLGLAILRMKAEQKNGKGDGTKVSIASVFPTFILYFVGASILTTLVTSVCTGTALVAANGIFAFLKQLSKFFIVMAMGAIGFNTNLIKLMKTGGKPIFMGLCCWIAIACVSLGMQHFLGIL